MINSPRAQRTPGWLDGALVAGLVVTVLGTFLPWLQSGSVSRNSYTTDGLLRRLLETDGAIGVVLDVWPFLAFACAAAAALTVLRVTWAALALALPATALAGTVAVVVLDTDVHFIVRPATSGPAVTAAGAILSWLAILARFIRRPR